MVDVGRREVRQISDNLYPGQTHPYVGSGLHPTSLEPGYLAGLGEADPRRRGAVTDSATAPPRRSPWRRNAGILACLGAAAICGAAAYVSGSTVGGLSCIWFLACACGCAIIASDED